MKIIKEENLLSYPIGNVKDFSDAMHKIITRIQEDDLEAEIIYQPTVNFYSAIILGIKRDEE
jgi:hypothetical protein